MQVYTLLLSMKKCGGVAIHWNFSHPIFNRLCQSIIGGIKNSSKNHSIVLDRASESSPCVGGTSYVVFNRATAVGQAADEGLQCENVEL